MGFAMSSARDHAAGPDARGGTGAALVRGASGGLLFGVPLLYTVEVWWYGSRVDPRWALGALAISLGVVTVLARTGGFRDARGAGWRDAALDGLGVVALALVSAAAVLVLLRQITPSTSLDEAVGATVFEAIPFAVGAALAPQLLRDAAPDAGDTPADEAPIGRTLADVGAAAVGALVLSFSIAPTDEIPLIASAVTGPWLVLIAGASLIVSYAIVFAAGFRDQHARHRHEGLLQRPVPETVAAYVVSLAVAAAMLLFFQRIGPDQSWETWVTYTVVLGLPATVGGAAGRLAV